MPELLQPFFPDRLACVIFDIDGTLARSNDLVFASFNHVARKYLGTELTRDEIVSLFGPPEEGGLKRILRHETVEEAMDDLCAFYEREHAGLVSLHQGVEDVLTFLDQKGVPLAVFTGKGRRTATITLEHLGILRRFDLVITGSDVARHKPHPEGIFRILDRFGVSAERALMVGDSVSDIDAARSAGVAVACVLWDSLDRQAVVNADANVRFDKPGELLLWLQRQFVS
jgi:HAD superfamily hydrolase (TIGR01549 family)